MKLLHKQLLAVCLPFLALAVMTWIVNGFLEQAERRRLQEDARESVKLHAASLSRHFQILTAQLRLLADLPAFQSDDPAQIQAELQRLNEQQAESFTGLFYHTLQVSTLAANGSNITILYPQDESLLAQGKTVATDIRQPTPRTPPVTYLAVPIPHETGNPLFALIGELPLTRSCPLLDPNLVRYTGNYSVTDFQGREYSAAHVQRSSPPNLRANQPQSDLLLQSLEIERFSTSVPPWNWQLNQYVTYPLALSALRFQRDQLICLSLMCMFFAAAGIFWVHRGTFRRLRLLTETLQRFGAGEQDRRSTDLSSDELGRLADAFNCMADDILHAQKKLQTRLVEHERSPHLWKQELDELRAKTAELERFTAMAAHELKSPLVTMQAFAKRLETAARTGVSSQFQDDVQSMQRTGRHLQQMVDALLRLAKAGQKPNWTEDVSLQAAASSAVELLHGTNNPQPIEIVISPNLPTVRGDPVLWRHLYQNLIENAQKASRENPTARIEIGSEQREEQTIYFVRDNGKGLNPEECTSLFERASSGLGLLLVRQIIELHGGNVWPESRAQGCQITWSLPNKS